MHIDLSGRRALVTGGASGIGRTIVDSLLGEGVTVCVIDMQAPASADGASGAQSGSLIHRRADVSDELAARQSVDDAVQEMGGLDIVVNNAGITRKGLVERIPMSDWRSTFAVNVDGVVHVCRAAIPHLRASEHGRIINAASFAALVPSVGGAAYSASKSAVVALTRVLASELGPSGITVNAYAPGMIPTAMNGFADLDEDAAARKLSQVALNRWGSASDIASLITYLSSDAASYITGSLIDISGGKLATQDPSAAW